MSRNKKGSPGGIRDSSAFTYCGLLLLATGTGAVSLLAATAVYGMPMFWAYLRTPALLALNILPVVLLVAALYFATGRAWIAFFAPSLLIIAAACANFFKIQLRGDPMIAEDIALMAEAGKMLSGFKPIINWKIIICAVYLALGTALSAVFLKYRPNGWKMRLLTAVFAVAVLFGAGIPVYASEGIYDAVICDYNIERLNTTERYVMRGFVFPFLHSIKGTYYEPPADYSEEKTKEILEEYIYDDISVERPVNVISVMLEAFYDVSEYELIKFETDVFARWHALQDESISGKLITNIFGGGTIDTERLFLLGETSQRTLNGRTQSYLYYLRDQGYYTEGFHPGDGWFYDRENIHRYIGFENYYFIEDFEDAASNDEYFFSKVLELYNARDKSVPYFSHNLTIQNHGGYYSDVNYGEGMISPEGLTEPTYNILSNYLIGMYDTNERIYEFIEQLRYDPEPVVVLIYGDHKPWLGNYESVYKELGINLDVTTMEGLFNMYSTPYIIWANEAAKEELDNDFSGDGGYFSPCFLMNRLFALCDWSGDDFMKLSNRVFESIPVINTPTGQYVENGVLTSELSESSKELLQELSFAEYFRRTKF